jgi:hypothetical protein
MAVKIKMTNNFIPFFNAFIFKIFWIREFKFIDLLV